MYAVIETGGKQYRVKKNDELRVEKLSVKAGGNVVFDKVIAVGGETLKIGKPYIEDCTVKAKVLEHGKGEKLIIYKYKAKKDYRKKNGHRQPYTLVKIVDIVEPGKSKNIAEAKPADDKTKKTDVKKPEKSEDKNNIKSAADKKSASSRAKKDTEKKPAKSAAAEAQKSTVKKAKIAKDPKTADVKVSMSMKKEELLAIAKVKGIKIPSNAKKADIIAAIEEK